MNSKKLFAPSVIRNLLLILFAGSVVMVYSKMNGIVGRTQLNGSGCTCHGSANDDVSVEIIGPDELEFGQTANYIARLKGGPASKGGINIAADNFTLKPVSDFLKSLDSELTHTSAVSMTGDSIDFEFAVTAPQEEGSFTLYTTGISTNANSSTGGDAWNHAPNKTVSVSSATSVISSADVNLPEQFRLGQNYPNPFNPQTVIPFTLKKQAKVTLSVYDISGQKVASLVDGQYSAGSHRVTFHAQTLNSGTYIYQLKSEELVLSRKMMVVK